MLQFRSTRAGCRVPSEFKGVACETSPSAALPNEGDTLMEPESKHPRAAVQLGLRFRSHTAAAARTGETLRTAVGDEKALPQVAESSSHTRQCKCRRPARPEIQSPAQPETQPGNRVDHDGLRREDPHSGRRGHWGCRGSLAVTLVCTVAAPPLT